MLTQNTKMGSPRKLQNYGTIQATQEAQKKGTQVWVQPESTQREPLSRE